ncbi:MAG: nucleoside hydrolase [Lachnospiraceae bacterium]|nr:nucleoside hydrolase [Lachnospiraceae bacterium]
MEMKYVNNIQKLMKPKRKIDVVLDTDTFNEIDDQYALAYLINSQDKLNLKAVYAAPFYNYKVCSAEEGMQKSYEEIFKVLKLMNREELNGIVFKGSKEMLKDIHTPVISDASKHLVELAKLYSEDNPLYVVCISTLTDIASAIIQEPSIIDKIVLVWLGGHAHDWCNDESFNLFYEGCPNEEFNLMQDTLAAKVVFDSGIAMVQLPCMGVVSAFTTTGPELEYWLRGKNKLCDYLIDVTKNEAKVDGMEKTWSRAIWDVTAVAWLLDGNFMYDKYVPCPVIHSDGSYSFEENRHLIKYVYYIHRDTLFADLFKKLSM